MVLKTLIINSSNYVNGSNNMYKYTFPVNGGVKFNSKCKVGLSQIAMFNSSFNISSSLNNNTFSIVWYANYGSGITSQTFNITIPDGYYSNSDLNYYLQSQMIANKLYLINSSGQYVYFISIEQNTTKYAIQINIGVLPTLTTITTLNYTYPVSCPWLVQSTVKSPQLIINSGLQTFFGITSRNTFPLSSELSSITSNVSYVSDTCPIVNPINSYILTCNLVSSYFSIPDNIFYSVPLTSGFGSLITINNSAIIYNSIREGIYNNIIIQFYDQNLATLQFVDKEIVLILSIDIDE
jgi:hypothetical protein